MISSVWGKKGNTQTHRRTHALIVWRVGGGGEERGVSSQPKMCRKTKDDVATQTATRQTQTREDHEHLYVSKKAKSSKS